MTDKVKEFQINSTVYPVDETLSFPSSQYDTLTVGASGVTYTAPANGWYSYRGSHTVYIGIHNHSKNISSQIADGSNWSGVFMPARKGDTISIEYGGNSGLTLTFIYAEGSKTT